MGVLYVRSGGAWVPVSAAAASIPAGSSYVTSPAQAGHQTESSANARFGNVSVADKNVGYMAGSTGYLDVIAAYGTPIVLYTRNSAGTGYMPIARFATTTSSINGWGIGPSPPHGAGWEALWYDGYTAAGDYTLMTNVNTTILNARSNISVRIGNAVILDVTAGATNQGVRQTVFFNTGNESWATAQQEIASGTGSGSSARVTLHHYYAPQFRCHQAAGDRISFMNEAGANYCNVEALGYITSSALALKTDVRSLSPQRERIVVRHDPLTDTVPPVDIMALRPVTFRSSDPVLIGIDDDGNRIPEPPESVLAIEKARERLGMVADEVQHIIPSAVDHDRYGNPRGIDYAQITVALLDHVQRLTEEVATLRYRVAELEGASP